MIKLIPLLLIFTANSFAFDNPYVDKNIDKNVSNFISSEIILSFNKAVDNYNHKRGELPEITRSDRYFTITKDNSIVEFDIPMFLSKTFLLNGKPVKYKDIHDLEKVTKKVSFFESISLIDSAYADEFVNSISANRILFASLISLEGKLEDAGFTNSNDQLNFSKIANRIKFYNEACEKNQANPEESTEVSALLRSVATVSLEMTVDRKKIDKLLNSKLGSDLKKPETCEKQVQPFLKTGLLNISRYTEQNAEGVDTVTIPTLCSKIQNLKQCLSNAYTNNRAIIDSVYSPNKSDNDVDIKKVDFESATGIAR